MVTLRLCNVTTKISSEGLCSWPPENHFGPPQRARAPFEKPWSRQWIAFCLRQLVQQNYDRMTGRCIIFNVNHCSSSYKATSWRVPCTFADFIPFLQVYTRAQRCEVRAENFHHFCCWTKFTKVIKFPGCEKTTGIRRDVYTADRAYRAGMHYVLFLTWLTWCMPSLIYWRDVRLNSTTPLLFRLALPVVPVSYK